METATLVPDEIVNKVRPGDTVAHSFSAGPGWMRSVCREIRWTAALQEPPDDATTCPTCADLVAGGVA